MMDILSALRGCVIRHAGPAPLSPWTQPAPSATFGGSLERALSTECHGSLPTSSERVRFRGRTSVFSVLCSFLSEITCSIVEMSGIASQATHFHGGGESMTTAAVVAAAARRMKLKLRKLPSPTTTTTTTTTARLFPVSQSAKIVNALHLSTQYQPWARSEHTRRPCRPHSMPRTGSTCGSLGIRKIRWRIPETPDTVSISCPWHTSCIQQVQRQSRL
ncbi:hypothetical protein IWZ01DRAFT_561382 [Phyllosticta capitalensis]